MGVGSSSRFKRDAEFLIGCPNREARLQKLITKQASKIISSTSSFNLLVSVARAGDCSALLCALDVSRQALTAPSSAAQRDLAKKLRALFGSKARPAHAAQCIFTFTSGHYTRVTLGRLIVPRVDGTMPFLAAAEAGHWHVILWMASEGVNVLTHDERTGFGALHAAARGGQPELLQHLLAWDIEVLDNDGTAPLHSSSHRTLDGGAVYKWVDFPGMGRATPLMVASYFGEGECVRVLLQAGADITLSLRGGAALPLPSGSTAMHCVARGRSCQGGVELLKALYTAAGGPMVDNASNSTMRLAWEGDPAVDLRAQPNNLGVLPTSYASVLPGSVALERMLHPRLPVALVIRQEDPSWSGFDGGVPRLAALALDSLRKYHLATLDELERSAPAPSSPRVAAASCSTSSARRLLPRAGSSTATAMEDQTVRGGSAAAAALASMSGQTPPFVVQFASASRENLLALRPSNRSMSTQSLQDFTFMEMPAEQGGQGAVEALRQGLGARAGASRSVFQHGPALAEAATGSAGTLSRTWADLAGPSAGVEPGRRVSMERAQSSHVLPRRSRSPFQLGQWFSGPLGGSTSSTAPVRAQGRAAGSGVHAGASCSSWHGGVAFEDGGGAHGHFRFFSTPGGTSEAMPGSSTAITAGPLPGDFLHDTLDGVETESEIELQWALYSAQMESTRHSTKGAAEESGVGAAPLPDAEPEPASEQEAMPLLSRMVASVDRAAHRVPQMFGPAPMLSSLRGARRGGGDNSSAHGSTRSSVGALERSGRQRSLVSTLGSVDYERRCPICMDGAMTVQVTGCKHGMCVACARTLCTSVSRAPVCPMCRKTVDTFERMDAPISGRL